MNENFKQRLFAIADRQTRQHNTKFTDVAKWDLNKFVNHGVDRMTENDLIDESKRALAERNFLRFIEAIISSAKNRKLLEGLDYRSFSDARNSIGPLWPFC